MDEKVVVIYDRLLAKYFLTGMIGRSKPFSVAAARQQAYAAANAMAHRKVKKATTNLQKEIRNVQLRLKLDFTP